MKADHQIQVAQVMIIDLYIRKICVKNINFSKEYSQVMTFIYSGIMTAILVGLMVQVQIEGLYSPTTLSLIFVAGSIILAGNVIIT